MQFRIFTLPFDSLIQGFDDSAVLGFIADKEVLSIREYFFTQDDLPYPGKRANLTKWYRLEDILALSMHANGKSARLRTDHSVCIHHTFEL